MIDVLLAFSEETGQYTYPRRRSGWQQQPRFGYILRRPFSC